MPVQSAQPTRVSRRLRPTVEEDKKDEEQQE